MAHISVSHLSHEHTDWLRALDFYEDELDILENRLAEVAGKNNGREAMAGIEHFQNQFVIQRNNIDEIRHSINENLSKIAADVKVSAGHVDYELVEEHDSLREDYIGLEKVINELRHEFSRFLAKWM